MLVLTIYWPNLNMGHVVSKTRTPCQIWGNSCLHCRHCTRFRWNLIRMFVWVISRPSSNMVMSSQKQGHQVKPYEKKNYTLDATFATQFRWNFVRIYDLAISRPSLNMGHVGSKTRSPGQILRNSCLHSRGYICDLILMKLGQIVRFHNI